MSVFDEPKIDCHNHVLDPARFPYQPDTFYRPSGHEIAPAATLFRIMDTYGVRHTLTVGPNSGYGTDNRCLLDAIAASDGRMKGIAVVAIDTGTAELARLKSQGIVGVAFNTTLMGVEHYLGSADLLSRLADLDMLLQLQVEKDQLAALRPLLEGARVRLLIDHCGRPDPAAGLAQPGFATLLALGRERRAVVKLSGFGKLSRRPVPHEDAWTYVRALVEAFTLDACVWGSDWPFLRASERTDYGPLLTMAAQLFPDATDRRKLFWETPARLFGFNGAS